MNYPWDSSGEFITPAEASISPWQSLVQQFLNIYEERASQLDSHDSDIGEEVDGQEYNESYYEYIRRQRKLRKKRLYQKELSQMKQLQLGACRVLQGFYSVIKAKNTKRELARLVENRRLNEVEHMESEEIYNKINKILHLRDTIRKIDQQKQILLLEVDGNIDNLPNKFQPRYEGYKRKACNEYIMKLFEKNIKFIVNQSVISNDDSIGPITGSSTDSQHNNSDNNDTAAHEISSILNELICLTEIANTQAPAATNAVEDDEVQISSILDDLIRLIEDANVTPVLGAGVTEEKSKLTREKKKEEFLLRYNIMKDLQQQAVRTLQGFNRIVIAKNIAGKINSARVALQEQEQMRMFNEESYGQINNILHIRDTISRISNEKELLLVRYQHELEKINAMSPSKDVAADNSEGVDTNTFVTHSLFIENVVNAAIASLLKRYIIPSKSSDVIQQIGTSSSNAIQQIGTSSSDAIQQTSSRDVIQQIGISSRDGTRQIDTSSRDGIQQIDTSINWNIDINLEEYIDENVREYADEILQTPTISHKVIFSDSPDSVESPVEPRGDSAAGSDDNKYTPPIDYRRQHIEDMKAWNMHSPTPPTQAKPSKIPHRIKSNLTISTELAFEGSTPQYIQSNKSANTSPTSMYNDELINKLSEEWGIKNKNIIKTIIKRKHILTENVGEEGGSNGSPRLTKVSPTSLIGGRNKNYKNSFKKWRKWN